MAMLTISKQNLHRILSEDTEDIDAEEVEVVKQMVEAGLIKEIVTDFSMSEHHLGGDDVIGFVRSAVDAMKEGFEVETWYGEESECLVVGVKPGTVVLTDEIDYPAGGEDDDEIDEDGH